MIYKHEFRAMGCHMLAALDCSTEQVAEELDRVPEWFEQWESVLSRFRPESELSRLNNAPEYNWPVSETLLSVFQAAVQAERDSSGLVTPTILEALVAAGYNQSFETLSQAQYAAPVTDLPHYKLASVAWSSTPPSIRLPLGLRLDFGGIAKGWAAHQAMLQLSRYAPALVNAGGDIAISGPQQNGEPWPVDILDPLRPGESLGLLMLEGCGVATSGRDYRRWQQNDTWRHHIIDPRSGLPAETDVISATVIAPTVLKAETAAKTAMILGSGAGMNWLEAHSSLAGMLLLENDQIIYTGRFKNFLWS